MGILKWIVLGLALLDKTDGFLSSKEQDLHSLDSRTDSSGYRSVGYFVDWVGGGT